MVHFALEFFKGRVTYEAMYVLLKGTQNDYVGSFQ